MFQVLKFNVLKVFFSVNYRCSLVRELGFEKFAFEKTRIILSVLVLSIWNQLNKNFFFS